MAGHGRRAVHGRRVAGDEAWVHALSVSAWALHGILAFAFVSLQSGHSSVLEVFFWLALILVVCAVALWPFAGRDQRAELKLERPSWADRIDFKEPPTEPRNAVSGRSTPVTHGPFALGERRILTLRLGHVVCPPAEPTAATRAYEYGYTAVNGRYQRHTATCVTCVPRRLARFAIVSAAVHRGSLGAIGRERHNEKRRLR